MSDATGRNVGRPAARVAAGIFLTRILGFVRERVFASYFGSGREADAFRAALKIPNIIRNLLGEGTLSASFIPVYAALLERGEEHTAKKLAASVLNLVVMLAIGGAVAGAVFAPVITDIAAPGFDEATRDITVTLVRIMFPMAGIMIVSAWCLGVLNTHRRFFLSYSAPMMWNVAQIVTLVMFGSWFAGWRGVQLVTALAWGALAGSILQVAMQLPSALSLAGIVRDKTNEASRELQRVVRAWVPVVIGAGVWQVSSLIDTQLGSLAGPGSVAVLGYAYLLATLPVSLFGVSIAAASLPELSRDAATMSAEATRERLSQAAGRVAFFIVPSAIALAAFGDLAVGALYQTGSFDAVQTQVVTGVLAAYSIGLPAQASVRLLTSGHYALGDTRTPLIVALVTVITGATLGFVLMDVYGVAGIALGSAVAAYLNMALNYFLLVRRTGPIVVGKISVSIGKSLGSAVLSLGAGSMIYGIVAPWGIWPAAIFTFSTFGVVYVAATFGSKHPEAKALVFRNR